VKGGYAVSEQLCESEYIEALMADFGLTKSATIGDLLDAVIEDEEAETDEETED
jgi:hypothetical protein